MLWFNYLQLEIQKYPYPFAYMPKKARLRFFGIVSQLLRPGSQVDLGQSCHLALYILI